MSNRKNQSKNTTDKSDTIKEVLIGSLKNGCTVFKACKGADICRDTFYRWYNTDDKFKEAVDIAKQSRISMVEDALFENAFEHNNTTAQIFFLCNRDPDRWQHLYKIQASGNLGINTNMSDEDRKTLKEIGDAFIKSKVSNK